MHGDTHSFVIRIWQEAMDSEGNITAWRGSIDHVGSGERLHFYDLDRVVHFIQQQVGLDDRRSRFPTDTRADPDQT